MDAFREFDQANPPLMVSLFASPLTDSAGQALCICRSRRAALRLLEMTVCQASSMLAVLPIASKLAPTWPRSKDSQPYTLSIMQVLFQE